MLSVGRAVTHRNGCYISTPKSGLGRIVPYLRTSAPMFWNTWPSMWGQSRMRCCSSRQAVAVTSVSGAFRQRFSAACENVRRQGARVHDLRHFAGSMVARVTNLREVMAHLGHSTVDASLRYQHIVSGRDAEIAEALSCRITLTIKKFL